MPTKKEIQENMAIDDVLCWIIKHRDNKEYIDLIFELAESFREIYGDDESNKGEKE